MNMGGRIDQRLRELGWKQTDLLARVPDLGTATLSALINRDSKKSEYAAQIAEAIGVYQEWLTDGTGPKLLKEDNTPDSPPFPLPPMRQLPVFSWEAAGRDDRGKGENYMGVRTEAGPNGFILAVENNAVGDEFPKGGFVIVDPDLEAESDDFVVALAEGATVPILRKLIIDGGERWLHATQPGYGDRQKAAKIIGPVVDYSKPGKRRK